MQARSVLLSAQRFMSCATSSDQRERAIGFRAVARIWLRHCRSGWIMMAFTMLGFSPARAAEEIELADKQLMAALRGRIHLTTPHLVKKLGRPENAANYSTSGTLLRTNLGRICIWPRIAHSIHHTHDQPPEDKKSASDNPCPSNQFIAIMKFKGQYCYVKFVATL